MQYERLEKAILILLVLLAILAGLLWSFFNKPELESTTVVLAALFSLQGLLRLADKKVGIPIGILGLFVFTWNVTQAFHCNGSSRPSSKQGQPIRPETTMSQPVIDSSRIDTIIFPKADETITVKKQKILKLFKYPFSNQGFIFFLDDKEVKVENLTGPKKVHSFKIDRASYTRLMHPDVVADFYLSYDQTQRVNFFYCYAEKDEYGRYIVDIKADTSIKTSRSQWALLAGQEVKSIKFGQRFQEAYTWVDSLLYLYQLTWNEPGKRWEGTPIEIAEKVVYFTIEEEALWILLYNNTVKQYNLLKSITPDTKPSVQLVPSIADTLEYQFFIMDTQKDSLLMIGEKKENRIEKQARLYGIRNDQLELKSSWSFNLKDEIIDLQILSDNHFLMYCSNRNLYDGTISEYANLDSNEVVANIDKDKYLFLNKKLFYITKAENGYQVKGSNYLFSSPPRSKKP